MKLEGKVVPVEPGQSLTIRHVDVLEDQRSTRLALLLDLLFGPESLSIRLLFPSEKLEVEEGQSTAWILAALRDLASQGRLRQDGIYSIG
jgi:hypothetical protein